jgi:hypothetical protein
MFSDCVDFVRIYVQYNTFTTVSMDRLAALESAGVPQNLIALRLKAGWSPDEVADHFQRMLEEKEEKKNPKPKRMTAASYKALALTLLPYALQTAQTVGLNWLKQTLFDKDAREDLSQAVAIDNFDPEKLFSAIEVAKQAIDAVPGGKTVRGLIPAVTKVGAKAINRTFDTIFGKNPLSGSGVRKRGVRRLRGGDLPRSILTRARYLLLHYGVPIIPTLYGLLAEYLSPGSTAPPANASYADWYQYLFGTSSSFGGRLKRNHAGGTGVGGRGKPSAAQLRARKLFAARYGNKRRRMR